MITGTQCRMARAALKMKVAELAKLAGVSANTVVRLESGKDVNSSSASVIKAALQSRGVKIEARGTVTFVCDDGE